MAANNMSLKNMIYLTAFLEYKLILRHKLSKNAFILSYILIQGSFCAKSIFSVFLILRIKNLNSVVCWWMFKNWLCVGADLSCLPVSVV